MPLPSQRRCRECRYLLEESEFRYRREGRLALSSVCRVCRAALRSRRSNGRRNWREFARHLSRAVDYLPEEEAPEPDGWPRAPRKRLISPTICPKCRGDIPPGRTGFLCQACVDETAARYLQDPEFLKAEADGWPKSTWRPPAVAPPPEPTPEIREPEPLPRPRKRKPKTKPLKKRKIRVRKSRLKVSWPNKRFSYLRSAENIEAMRRFASKRKEMPMIREEVIRLAKAGRLGKAVRLESNQATGVYMETLTPHIALPGRYEIIGYDNGFGVLLKSEAGSVFACNNFEWIPLEQIERDEPVPLPNP